MRYDRRFASLPAALLVLSLIVASPAVVSAADPLLPRMNANVTLRFVDENGWPLLGVTASSNYYDSDYDADTGTWKDYSVSGISGKDGRVTLGYKLAEVSTVDVDIFDTWNYDSARTISVANLQPGRLRNLGVVTLRVQPVTGRAQTAIKTGSKKTVLAAYRAGYRKQLRNEKLLKVKGCRVAATPKSFQKRQLAAVNFHRSMIGVEKVKLSSSLSKKASKAALIQYRQGYLSHYPMPTTRCWSTTGAAASGQSNLSYGTAGAATIGQYIADGGANNAAVGHRRWIMDPRMTTIGTGQAGSYNALYVMGPSSERRTRPLWIQWPSAGYFPSSLEPNGRWSFMSSRSDINFRSAKVTVTAGGKKIRTKIIYRDSKPSAGSQMIMGNQWGMTFKVAKLPKIKGKKTVTAKVKVSGMTLRNGTPLPAVTYNVKLFNADK